MCEREKRSHLSLACLCTTNRTQSQTDSLFTQ
uniref:Uncharacterized protein n=1 Tax=Anguilla anguilla TaxID=7936 RepID=A0A0E9V6K9_ANGAN